MRAGVLISVPMQSPPDTLMLVHSYNLGTGDYNCTVAGCNTTNNDDLRVMSFAQVDTHACRVGCRLEVKVDALDPDARVMDQQEQFVASDFVACKLALFDDDDEPQLDHVMVSVQIANTRATTGRFMQWCGVTSGLSSTARMFQVSVHALRASTSEAPTFVQWPAEN